jgi:hypothetical protein
MTTCGEGCDMVESNGGPGRLEIDWYRVWVDRDQLAHDLDHVGHVLLTVAHRLRAMPLAEVPEWIARLDQGGHLRAPARAILTPTYEDEIHDNKGSMTDAEIGAL